MLSSLMLLFINDFDVAHIVFRTKLRNYRRTNLNNAMLHSLFDAPIIGGITLGLVIAVNLLIVRYIMQYQRETRDEYTRRLTRAVIELEVQKTLNAKLEADNYKLRYLRDHK